MEDFDTNNTSPEPNVNYRKIFFIGFDYSDIDFEDFVSNNSAFEDYEVIDVVMWTVSFFGLPLFLVAIYAVYSLVQKNNVAPIFVINLLISDLIQFCCMISWVAKLESSIADITSVIYYFGLMASVCFMVGIALERYLVIACPLWYRFRRTIKTSVVICVVLWTIPLLCLFILFLMDDLLKTIFAVFFLLPLPLLVFFLGGTLKALSAAVSVPSEEKRRIVGMLVLVLLIYMLLFLPNIIWVVREGGRFDNTLHNLSSVCLRLSPLADLFLYVFMRKGAIDSLLASFCCCRMDSNDIRGSSV